ncbi:alkaline phosphatase D family protein [Paraburkholderia edwinii]|nr:alkaline phosphatase D family protein [Paraburkholderia edwinii]
MTVSAASTTILSACGGGDDSPSSSSAAASGGPLSFSQGVASGDPQPDSVVLWTRVSGGDGIRDVNVGVQVSTTADFTSLVVNTTVAASADWDYTLRHQITGLSANTIYFYRFITGGVTSMTGRTWTLPASGQALTQLKFAVISCQDWSVNHWAAFDAMQNEDINFIVHVGNYVYEQIGITLPIQPARDPQHPAFKLPNGTALPDGSTYATTLADYRTLYMTYRSDPRLQRLHANWPMIAIWNDHEFSSDSWQDHETYTSAEAEQTARRRSANQAWFEFMPTNVTFNAANTSFQNIQIYRSFTFGNLATLVMTDERLYRAAHEVAEQVSGNPVGSRYFVPKATVDAAEQARLTASNNALTPVSMLGDTQRQWWQDQMSTATTTWKLWGNDVSLLRMQADMFAALTDALTQTVLQTAAGLGTFETQFHTAIQADLTAAVAGNLVPAPFTNLDTFARGLGFDEDDVQATIAALNTLIPPYSVLTTMLMNADQWDGYNAERLSLMSFLTNNSIRNVVALTGDLNAFAAGTVMNDFDAATPVPVMVDLVTAGISSTSLFTSYVTFVNNPANHLGWLGKVAPATGPNSLDTMLTSNNSWLAYADTNAQGYSVITLTPGTLTCNFRKLAPVSPTGQVPTAANAVASTRVVTVQANTAEVTVSPM